MKTILFLRPQQMDHAENRACELGNDRCKRRRTDPHAKPSDKKQVEHNIDARRYDQIDQRVTAVANGLQDADENVIHDKTKRSCKIGTEIFDGLRQDIGRCSHQHKDFRRQIHAKHSQRYTGRQAERHGRMDRFLQIFPVFRSVIPCNHDTGAHCDTVNKTNHQKDQIARRADRCQRIASQKISYNQRVGRIVQLLEQIAKEQRDRKQNHLF